MGRAIQIDAILAGVIDPNTGLPAAGGTVYFYQVDTTTAKNVWTEAAKSNAYTSYTLDAAGSAHLYGDGIYDIVVQNSAGSTIYEWDGVRLRYPDYQTTTVSTNYTQVEADDCITVSDSAAANVTITLINADDWEDRPLVVFNASGTYTVTITPESGSGQTIDGESSITLAVGASAVSVFMSGDDFYSSGAATDTLTATDSSGRSLSVDQYGAKDNGSGITEAFYLLGHGTYACRIISAFVSISYSAASQVSVAIATSSSYGFAQPDSATSGGIAKSGSANGFTLSSTGQYVTISNAVAYTESADTGYFVGVLGAIVGNYNVTTSGVPTMRTTLVSTTGINLYYYEDGSGVDLTSALASVGDFVYCTIIYAMRPVTT